MGEVTPPPYIYDEVDKTTTKHMAKAILEYDLNDFDDQMAHRRAIKSTSMALALWEIIYNTKKRVENEIERDEHLDLSQYDLLDKVYEHILNVIKENNINIDELID